MQLVLFATGLFLTAFIIHLIVWRIRLPQKHTFTLLIIFLGILFISPLILQLIPSLISYQPRSLSEWFHVSLFHIALTLGYIVTYSAIEEDSPSLCLIRYVADAGTGGRTDEEVRNFLSQVPIIEMRIQASLRDNLMIKQDDKYQLTEKGRRLALVFKFTQDILGMRTGG